jgi:hypothetical protein
MFSMKDRNTGQEKEMSVASYFGEVLGIRLEFPALQCVTVRHFSPATVQHDAPTSIMNPT